MPVDINSTKSVRHVLFEALKLEVPNSRKTRTGKIKTDADVSSLVLEKENIEMSFTIVKSAAPDLTVICA